MASFPSNGLHVKLHMQPLMAEQKIEEDLTGEARRCPKALPSHINPYLGHRFPWKRQNCSQGQKASHSRIFFGRDFRNELSRAILLLQASGTVGAERRNCSMEERPICALLSALPWWPAISNRSAGEGTAIGDRQLSSKLIVFVKMGALVENGDSTC